LGENFRSFDKFEDLKGKNKKELKIMGFLGILIEF
jgi:hypothetical protein